MKLVVTSTLLALVFLLPGCATVAERPAGPKASRIGKPAEQLVADLGQPRHIIHSTLEGGPVTYSYLYNNGSCVDTYTVEATTGQILTYACM